MDYGGAEKLMRIEVLNTGSELLLGSVINTHVRLFAEALFPLGLRIERQVTVPDGWAIREALEETFGRADILLVTGGLGPTTDDITREIVAECLGLPLEFDEKVWAHIEQRFAKRGLHISPRNRLQALRPAEATVLWNPFGTAPGLYLPAFPEKRSPHLFLLPGPPRELQPMMGAHVVPLLRTLAPADPDLAMRVWRTVGLGESHVEEIAGEELLQVGAELGYCARPGEVDIRIVGTREQVEQADAIVQRHFGTRLVPEENRSLEEAILSQLTSRGQTLAIAESCTGGAIANRLTNVPGASAAFLAGYITYANEAKTNTLGVPPDLIAEHGAVSEAVARAMAEGARTASGATFALSTTGIAGPGGGSAEKPVGTVFVAFASKGRPTRVEKMFFPTERLRFKEIVTQMSLDLLRRALAEDRRD